MIITKANTSIALTLLNSVVLAIIDKGNELTSKGIFHGKS